MKPIVLLEVGDEVNAFLEAIDANALPTIDMDQVLDCVLGSLADPRNKTVDQANLAFLAADIAYGEGMLSGPQEGDGFSAQQRHAMVLAVMELGAQLRYRLMDLKLISQDGATYSHRFKEIERDHLLRLEQDSELTLVDYSGPRDTHTETPPEPAYYPDGRRYYPL